MVTLTPVKEGWIAADNSSANILIGPNYDEFQSDMEIFNILKDNRENILAVCMPHCDTDKPENMMADSSDKALEHGLENFNRLVNGERVKKTDDFLWVYEITSSRDPSQKQIGIGGMAKTAQIRTDKNPEGTIIRNEEVNPKKVEGRAKSIKKLNTYLEIVNNAVVDKGDKLLNALNGFKADKKADITARDEQNNIHNIWLVTDKKNIDTFIDILSNEEFSFVADGNHRSAAAAMLGYENFLTVFFPIKGMALLSYNRLLKADKKVSLSDLIKQLSANFTVEELKNPQDKMPDRIHNILIYTEKKWLLLIPKMDKVKPSNIVEEIDSNIIQRKIFDDIFGIKNTNDKQINYVGGNKDIFYLKGRVDSGEFDYAIVVSPVDMMQIVDVSKNNFFMPPKSTWFDPKIRIGLVFAKIK